jgi:short-subunit dehydrogenase
MLMTLRDKVYVLTGATGGIGQAIAKRLAKQGSRLILIGRSESALNTLIESLGQNSKGCSFIVADISSHEGREAILTALLELKTPLNGLINCAGINHFSFLTDTDPALIEKIFATNVTAPILLTRLVMPFLNISDARILQIGSSFGALGYAGFSAYCASKFALRGFTQALRRELADTRIQIAYLAPRATQTTLNTDAICAMNKELGVAMDDPDVVAEQVEQMLLSKKMRDRNIGWPERLFIRINSVFPAFIDMALRKQLPIISRYAKNISHTL